MNGNCYSADGVNPTLTTNKGEGGRIAIPVLTPDRATKRQNGRRFKEDGEPAFTLTGQDRHGVAIGVIDDQGRTQKKCEVKETVPTLRSESHGNQPKAVVCIEDFYRERPARVYEDEAHSLNCTDQRKVFGAHQTRTMVGYNATLKRGGV